uniref:Uncharacterized protein n=1 Tax=Vitis vinifera TaxID=29760 RepID=A5C8Y2_VITVI|nr:hypothetical protein VITISV_001295 [Vitis vinifera]
MELFRIAMRAPCHQGEGSLHLAHADGPPCDIAHSTRGKNSVRRHFTSGYLTSGWERRTFQLPRSDMSGSSDRIFHIQMSHSRMGEEGISTSPIRHVRIL